MQAARQGGGKRKWGGGQRKIDVDMVEEESSRWKR